MKLLTKLGLLAGLALSFAGCDAEEALANTVILDISDREVRVVTDDGEFELARFTVGVAKPGHETPIGSYKLYNKVYKPRWENPWTGEVRAFPRSPLGSVWLGFLCQSHGCYGLHGSLPSMANSIGQAESHGCVRLRDSEALELAELLTIGDLIIVQQ